MNYLRAMDRNEVIFDFMVHRSQPGDYEDEVLAMGSRIYRMPAYSVKNLFRYLSALRNFFRDYPEYRIIHAHLNALSVFVLRAAKQAGVSCRISHSHNTYSGRITIKEWLHLFLAVFLKNYCTHYFACSEHAGDYCFGKDVRLQGKLILLRNAIDTSRFATASLVRGETRSVFGFKEEDLIFGHVGRFEQQKNHLFLIDIFREVHKRCPRTILLLVGDGILRPVIEKKVKAFGLSDKVRFLGVRCDIPELLAAMDVFVFPSFFEGFPVALVEAQAAGASCFVSDKVSLASNVTGTVKFLSLSLGPEQWADEILRVRQTEHHRDAARKVTEAGFGITTNVQGVMAFYLNEYNKHSREAYV